MSENTVKSDMQQGSNLSTLVSILLIVAGIFAIVAPLIAGVTISILIAWLLVFGGVAHLVFATHKHTAAGKIWQILIGLVYIGIGIYMIAQPVAGLAALTLWLAIYLFVEAALEFFLWWSVREKGGAAWLLMDAIVTLILGAMIYVAWPSSAEWAIGTLIGISMLFSGFTRLAICAASKSMTSGT